jgi:hypothetical protein
MKTLFLIIALFTTQLTTTFATEVKHLTKDEYLTLIGQNSFAYEEVTPGMTIEYSDNLRVYTDNVLTATCAQSGEDTVMATNSTHYLVYRKITKDSDCDSYKKGEVTEFLTWRKIKTVEQEETFIINDLSNHRITQLNENTILITGTVKGYLTGEKVPFKQLLRLGVSQFRSTDHLEEDDYRYTLFWVSEVEPTSIEISHLLNRNQKN